MNNPQLVNVALKLSLILLLLICLLNMPYGYYQFVRFAALIGFGILAYQANERGLQIEMIILAVLALLFQPFIKIPFGRIIWNVIDIVVSVGLIISILSNKKDRA